MHQLLFNYIAESNLSALLIVGPIISFSSQRTNWEASSFYFNVTISVSFSSKWIHKKIDQITKWKILNTDFKWFIIIRGASAYGHSPSLTIQTNQLRKLTSMCLMSSGFWFRYVCTWHHYIVAFKVQQYHQMLTLFMLVWYLIWMKFHPLLS